MKTKNEDTYTLLAVEQKVFDQKSLHVVVVVVVDVVTVVEIGNKLCLETIHCVSEYARCGLSD